LSGAIDLSSFAWLTYLPYPILIAVIVFLFKNPDKVEKWSALFARLFSFFSARAERASVASDIQGRIDEFRKTHEFLNILPFGLKIRWQRGDTVSELKEGEVIIIMNEHRDQARNFLNGLMAYLSAGLLPKVRPYAPPRVTRAIELVTANKMLAKERTDAISIYTSEIADPEIKRDVELAETVRTLELFDDVGLFTRIFLNDLSRYGEALAGRRPSQDDWKTVRELMDMLSRLVTRPHGQDVGRDFLVLTNDLNLCVVLVAKGTTLATSGFEAHLNYVREKASGGVTHFHILSRGTYLKYAKQFVQKLEDSKTYQKDYEETFREIRTKQESYVATLHALKPSTTSASTGQHLAPDKALPMPVGKAVTGRTDLPSSNPSVNFSSGEGRDLLLRVIRGLDSARTVTGVTIGQRLKLLDPEFSPDKFGTRNLSAFLAQYPDLVTLVSPIEKGKTTATVYKISPSNR